MLYEWAFRLLLRYTADMTSWHLALFWLVNSSLSELYSLTVVVAIDCCGPDHGQVSECKRQADCTSIHGYGEPNFVASRGRRGEGRGSLELLYI